MTTQELDLIYEDLKNKFPSSTINKYPSMVWFQYSNSADTLDIEIYDWTTIVVSSTITTISYNKEILDIILKNTETSPIVKHKIPSYAIETLISNLYDSAGFYEDSSVSDAKIEDKEKSNAEIFWNEMKKLVDSTRKIVIVSFGEKFKSPISMEQNVISKDLPFACEKTFDARHINSKKPKGAGGLHDLRGTDEIIQKTIESGKGFEFVINCIVKSIEEHNYKVIGIYCTAGHHRSVALVELVKKHLYPNAKIKHLHINR